MAPPPPLTILDPYAWERSTVNQVALGELVSAGQLAANEEGRPAEWIVPPAGDHAPNPPEGYVVSFVRFHERGFAAPREPLHAGALPPLRHGVTQLRAERDFAGGHICGRLRRVSGDPGQLGALATPLPRGALHAADDGAEDPPRGTRRRHVARPADAVQGRLHPLHHDDEQRRPGAGMVLLAQRRARPPPTPVWCFERSPTPGATGCPRPSIGGGWTRSWPP
jgi:hypothetical protein